MRPIQAADQRKLGKTPCGALMAAALILSALVPPLAEAQTRCTQPVARLVSGRAIELRDVGASAWRPAPPDADLCPGDGLRTGENSRATVLYLATRVEKRIGDRTELIVRPPTPEGRTLINLIRGVFYFFSIEPRALEFTTPFLNGVVEGTEFVVAVDDTRTAITVLHGQVRASNGQGSVVVNGGQSAVASANQAPQLQQLYVQPRDAVQWAVYYEPIVAGEPLEALNQVPEGARDAAFFARRASALLSGGQLAAARDDIDAALARDPANGDALALRTIIDVALDDRARALEDSREAVERAPQSVSARVARSYALQANFALEAARDELLGAVALDPDHATAWARLAEVWLSLGDLHRAVDAANRAAALAPDLAHAQTVLGFAALTEFRLTTAESAFERALALDSEAPLAHLGLGLALIREGRLSDGLGEIKTAVMNDPSSALLRSYLGKAYFEAKQESAAAEQFTQAKELDTNDPTPFLYDAIRKQTLNRPVEALQDLQASIARNDNRAVYRSRLLLDQDLAARSAGLARIYRDLGFEQLALVQGWTSVNTDAMEYAGHRLLADVYSALPRHEVARVSELLQSQLLQPLNVSAVQPQLAEANLAIVDRTGPSDPAFNEFHPLFNRNRLSLLLSGAGGGHGTAGDEAVVSGVWNKLSFSAGQFHFDSDGFQENNGQDRDIWNAFVQASLTPATSAQAEIRTTDHVRGDLRLRFDPAQLRPFRDQTTDVDMARVGLRHAFNPRSRVIASFMRGTVRDQFDDRLVELGYPGAPGSLAIDVDSRGWMTEVQHLFASPSARVRLISGFGRFQATRDETTTLGIRIPVPPFDISQTNQEERDVSQTNAYVYSQTDLASSVVLTLGASGGFLRGRTVDTDQFNPKVGVSWRPTRTTTVRAAGFRTLHRSLVADQTIEPTQVAGFNQFFDGAEGERAWRYGVGADQKLSSKAYGGAEFSWRTLDVPGVVAETGDIAINDWSERFGRAYLYATPHTRLSLSLEYLFERFRRSGQLGEEQIIRLSTHRVPLGVAYFHPNGLIGRLNVVVVRQTGIFGTTELPAPGEDTLAVVDASVGFRLPKRYGLVTLEIKNLLNQEFRFQDTDPKFPRILPRRLVVFRFTVAL